MKISSRLFTVSSLFFVAILFLCTIPLHASAAGVSCTADGQGFLPAPWTVVLPQTSTVTVTYSCGITGYNNTFGYVDPVTQRLITLGSNQSGPSSGQMTLGNFPAGTEIEFWVQENGNGPFWFDGNQSRNSDGAIHADVRQSSSTWLVGFEDQTNAGDNDFNDVVLSVTATPGNPPPPPPTCTPNQTKKCVGNSVYNFDSCGAQGSLVQDCNGSTCTNGSCSVIPSSDKFLPLYRYFKSSNGGHFYTTGFSELGNGSSGYVLEGHEGYLAVDQSCISGLSPLYRYYKPSTDTHFYTTGFDELGNGADGYSYIGIQGYMSKTQIAGTTPLYRYWNSSIIKHFYTTNFSEMGNGANGYVYIGIQGYVFTSANNACGPPSPTCTPNATKKCVGNSVYWYDSCNTQGDVVQTCSGNQTCSNGSCNTNTSDLVVSCNATPNPANTNQSVTFNASATGGVGTYAYQWSAGCSGLSQTCSRIFTIPGTYTSLLTVTSGNQTQSTGCNVLINSNNNLSVTTKPATNILTNSATLNGSLNSLGSDPSASVWFQWGPSTSYAFETNHFTKTSANPFNDTIANLSPNMVYHFRAVAQDGSGTVYGSDMSFTSGNTIYPAQVQSLPATNIQPSAVTLNGQLLSLGGDNSAQVFFQWGPSVVYGNSTSNQTQNIAGQFSQTISGLAFGSTYHFRAGVQTSSGVVYGSDTSFATNTNGNTCTPNATKKCVGNSVYWYDSCNTQGDVVQTCSGNQTCSNGSCNTNTSDLVVSCNATPNPANTNQSVTFNASATGGVGTYAYQWSAGCSGLSQTCSHTFATPGIYAAVLTVTSGTQTKSTSCNVSINQTCTPHTSQKCVGNSVYWYDSCNTQGEVVQTCTGNQTCSGGVCQNINATCTQNSECGISGYIGDRFCQGGSVYQSYRTFTCNNPGTANSTCSNVTASQLQQTCTGNQTCSGGSCSAVVNTCTSNSYQQCLNGSVHWFNSCGADQGISQACTGNQTCSGNVCINQNTYNTYIYHASQRCVGNSVYNIDSNGATQDLAYACGQNQTCSGNTCVNQNPIVTSTYINHYITSCYGGNAYWQDSNGTRQDVAQYCNGNQTCLSGACINQNPIVVFSGPAQIGNLSISAFGKKETDPLQWVKYLTATGDDKIDFLFVIKNTSNVPINSAVVKAELPNNITYTDNLRIDDVAIADNVLTGVNLFQVPAKTSKSISFTGTVQSLNMQGNVTVSGNVTAKNTYDSDFLTINVVPGQIITTNTVNGNPNTKTASLWDALRINFGNGWLLWLIIIIIILVALFAIIFRRLATRV